MFNVKCEMFLLSCIYHESRLPDALCLLLISIRKPDAVSIIETGVLLEGKKGLTQHFTI